MYIVKNKICVLYIKLTWMVWADRLGRYTTRQGCVIWWHIDHSCLIIGSEIVMLILDFHLFDKFCIYHFITFKRKSIDTTIILIFGSPEPKAQGELIVWDSSRHPCVHPCVHTFKHEYLWDQLNFIWSIIGVGDWLHKVLGLIRTLVSMATDSSHRAIMGKILWPL